jgi:hypothetical protein
VSRTIYTIGHSLRTIADFIALLRQVDIDLLVDVRSIPRSRAAPQFDFDTLPVSLAAGGIGYEHLRALGGRRHHPKSAPPSTITFWRMLAFRNYADYAEADAFEPGFNKDLFRISKRTHVQLAGGRSRLGTVRYPVDHDATRPADPLSPRRAFREMTSLAKHRTRYTSRTSLRKRGTPVAISVA